MSPHTGNPGVGRGGSGRGESGQGQSRNGASVHRDRRDATMQASPARVRSGQDFIYGREGTTESPYLSLGLSLREDATDTLADDWLLSLCASLSSRRYSSPELKGNGVTLSGVWLLVGWALSSTHDSAIRRHPVF